MKSGTSRTDVPSYDPVRQGANRVYYRMLTDLTVGQFDKSANGSGGPVSEDLTIE